VLRPEQGTKPQVYYIGADRNHTEFARDAYRRVDVMEPDRAALNKMFRI
jgi:hypothetical protein